MPRMVAYLAFCLSLALVLAGCSGDGDLSVSVFTMRTGDCFNNPGDVTEEIVPEREVPVVPCRQPHDSEVFAVLQHPGGKDAPFPGDAEIERFAERECLGRFEGYVGKAYADSTLKVATIGPVEESWDERDDRDVACYLYAEGQRLTGSQKGSGI